jgi:hypothetical protein
MLTQTITEYQAIARHRFPYSRSNIHGDGRYCAVTKCAKRWRIFLFHTSEDRDARLAEWRQRSCPSGVDCIEDHVAEDLHLR